MIDDVPFDELERRPPEVREAALLAALPDLVRRAKATAPGLARHLEGVEPEKVTGRRALAALPLVRKSELIDRQEQAPPFGGLVATPIPELARCFMSPGPIFEVEGTEPDFFRMARAMHAASFRRGDLVHNTFAYHLTPAGAMMESGARRLGCPVIPAGTGQTSLQVEAIRRLRPAAYTGTPSYLRVLLDHGLAEGGPLDSFTKALVSGEAFPRTEAEELESRHGIAALQCYGTADVGLIAYETQARDGLVLDEGVLLELVAPDDGGPVPEGRVGEVVVTTFNPVYPLIRFATGDLSAVMPGPSASGRTNWRLAGWLGRADQSTKVRGLFVHPRQVAQTVARHPGVGRARLVVERTSGRDEITLHCEADGGSDGLEQAIAESFRAITGLRSATTIVAPGSLADDDTVIDDRRDHR